MFSFVNFKSGLLLHLHDLKKGDTNQKSLGFLFVGWDSYFSWKLLKSLFIWDCGTDLENGL